MRYFFSPSTGGFYTSETHGDRIPADAVKVTARRHAQLMAAQADGAVIVAGKGGKPEAIAPADAMSPSNLRAALARAIRAEAARRIARISPAWRQMNDIRQPSEAGDARFAAIDAVRAASDTIETALAATADDALTTFDPSNRPEWPAEPR